MKGIEVAHKLEPLISLILDRDMPTFGVCFGHQIIARVRGGGVINDAAQAKAGSFSVKLTSEGKMDALFNKMPETFIVQYGHKDSITVLPRGAVLLATGPACKFSALRYGNKVYTTQFHPELSADDVRWRLKNSTGYLPASPVDSVVRESPHASKLISAWVNSISL